MSFNEWLNKKRNEAVVQDERVREMYMDNLFNQARSFNSNVTPKEQKTDEVLADIFNNISKLSNEIDGNIIDFQDLENLNLQIDVVNEEIDDEYRMKTDRQIRALGDDEPDVEDRLSEINAQINEKISKMDNLGAIPYYYNLISNKFNLILKNKLDKSQIDKFNTEMDFVLKQLTNLSDLYEVNPSIEATFKDKKILDEMIQYISDRSYRPIKFSRKIKLSEYATGEENLSSRAGESVLTQRNRVMEDAERNAMRADEMTPEQMQALFDAGIPRGASVASSGRTARTEEIADFAGVEPEMIRRLREGRGKKRGGMKKGLPESEDMILSDFKNNILENKKKKMINLYDDRKNTPYID